MESLPAARKAVLFSAGGVRLALRLSQVREIVALPDGAPEATSRGAPVPALPVAVALGLPAAPARFAVVVEASPAVALRVETVHGIIDLASAEVFQLPARTLLPAPAPFHAALVTRGEIALELAIPTLGWAPIEPASELPGPPPALDFPIGRELLFERAGRVFAVPLQLLARVLEAPRLFPVPLAPSAHRGLLYHGRAIHPVFDVPILYGDVASPAEGAKALLVDAGGNAIAVLADRILPGGGGGEVEVERPSWDAIFSAV
jgi:chemotaxis signal transduction protein